MSKPVPPMPRPSPPTSSLCAKRPVTEKSPPPSSIRTTLATSRPTRKIPARRFVTVGALPPENGATSISSSARSGTCTRRASWTDFQVDVIGKSSRRHIPPRTCGPTLLCTVGSTFLKCWYSVVASADYISSRSWIRKNPSHQRYVRTGTSGSFQLAYGFAKALHPRKHLRPNSPSRRHQCPPPRGQCPALTGALKEAIALSPEAYARQAGGSRRDRQSPPPPARPPTSRPSSHAERRPRCLYLRTKKNRACGRRRPTKYDGCRRADHALLHARSPPPD